MCRWRPARAKVHVANWWRWAAAACGWQSSAAALAPWRSAGGGTPSPAGGTPGRWMPWWRWPPRSSQRRWWKRGCPETEPCSRLVWGWWPRLWWPGLGLGTASSSGATCAPPACWSRWATRRAGWAAGCSSRRTSGPRPRWAGLSAGAPTG